MANTGDFIPSGYATTGGYVPGTTTVTVTPLGYAPGVCPDCGRCRTCGQEAGPTKPVEVKSIWNLPGWSWSGTGGSILPAGCITLSMSDALAGEVR